MARNLSTNDKIDHPTAVVMNMFYSGLGIARSLGELGLPVVGLTSQRGIYGNFTRYANVRFCPDSKTDPEGLFAYLTGLAGQLGHRAIIFPTRDADLAFLDRFRERLSPHFEMVLPERSVLKLSLDKWETYKCAQRAGVSTPKSWVIESDTDFNRIVPEITYPVVLKPIAADHWRHGNNWTLVGGRKAIAVSSQDELLAEYTAVARANPRVLVQELIQGSDEFLFIAACYFDKNSNCAASFNTRKLLQVPQGFGTGCIVQTANLPEVVETTVRLLAEMRFTGVAEVEYKWDSLKKEYRLIEINPRPWDQHRLGQSCGVDLIHFAYCEKAGLPQPKTAKGPIGLKWIAEDTFITLAVRLIYRGDSMFWTLLRLARGKRIYAIWSWRDPLPAIAYCFGRFIPGLLGDGLSALGRALNFNAASKLFRKKDQVNGERGEKGAAHG